MAVLLYQIGIFLAIIITSLFGKKTRNTAVILISIFTILQVYMSWLLLLQFVTIYIAYRVSINLTGKKTKNETLSKNQKSPKVEFRDRNQEIEYAQLSRKHTANILTDYRAPSKPRKPFSIEKEKPEIQSRIIYVILLLVLTVILSYLIPFVILVDWLEEELNVSKFQFFTFCGILYIIIQSKYYIGDINEFKKKSERYKVALKKYEDKLRQYKLDLKEYEGKHKSLNQIKIENAELERRMSELKNNSY